MIPPFDENGHLPSGIHEATFDEVIKRFSMPKSRVRESRTQKLKAFYAFISPYAKELYIDGSYTTSKSAPKDVDVVVFWRDSFVPSLRFFERFRVFQDKASSHLQIITYIPGDQVGESMAWKHVNYFQQNDRNFDPPAVKGIILLRFNND